MLVRTLSVIVLSFITAFKARAEETGNTDAPKPGKVIERLTGDVEVEELLQGDDSVYYRAGVHRVPTPLPKGYPRPTPPGVVEIKSYPEVRRATFEGRGSGPDGMKNSAGGFWPLFGHIKSRGIAMTGPVEIEYQGLESGDTDGVDGWSMSFLYRTKALGPTESYANITVEDAKPVIVITTGVAGDATRQKIDEALKLLEKTLADSDQWQPAGDVRIMGYNGPEVPSKERWSEVQIPVVKEKSNRE